MIPLPSIGINAFLRAGYRGAFVCWCLLSTAVVAEARIGELSTLLAACPTAVVSGRFNVPLPVGETLTLVAPGAPDLQRCQTVPLGVGVEHVRWLGVLSNAEAQTARRIVLTLRADLHKTVTAEVERPIAPVELRRLMPRKRLFPLDSVRMFGNSGRARTEESPTHVDLLCTAGDEPAGAVFNIGSPSQGASLAIELEAEGDEGFRAQMTAQDNTATDAGVAFAGPARRRSARLPVPKAVKVALVVSCPTGAGRLSLTRGTVVSARAPDFDRPGAWVWSAARWQDQPEELLATAKKRGIGTLYITVPINGAGVSEPGHLANFVARAKAESIAIIAVEGDPGMVSGRGRAEAVERASALAAFQAAAPDASRLAGVQYDIEPYFLPGFSIDPIAIWRAWAETLSQLAAAFDNPVDVVVPHWIMGSPGGPEALSAARPYLRRVAIMAYRTAPSDVIVAAEPILAWASIVGLPVSVALESGPLPAERRDIFISASMGELQVILLGQLAAVVLFDGVQAAGPGQSFRKSHSVAADLSRVSFFGDATSLSQVVAAVTPDLAAWPAMRGLAFHGIVELDPSPSKSPAFSLGDAP